MTSRPTDEMVYRLALYYERKTTHPAPDNLLQVPMNRRQRAVDEARKALNFAFAEDGESTEGSKK